MARLFKVGRFGKTLKPTVAEGYTHTRTSYAEVEHAPGRMPPIEYLFGITDRKEHHNEHVLALSEDEMLDMIERWMRLFNENRARLKREAAARFKEERTNGRQP